MKNYSIKEIYLTVQGEGANVGRVAVFVRFTGCNLWSGRQEDRKQSCSAWCDTDFVGTDGPGGGKFDTVSLVRAVLNLWPGMNPFVVLTGGEPLLQVDELLLDELYKAGCFVAVETNGTVEPPRGVNWLTVSPKAGQRLTVCQGDELKLVYPQEGVNPEAFSDLGFRHLYLQPMDGADREENTRQATLYCMSHPRWRLSVQTHKYLGIP